MPNRSSERELVFNKGLFGLTYATTYNKKKK